MSFRLSALPRETFTSLFALDDAALTAHGARRVIASADTGFPCRVSLTLARQGERLILANHEHQPARSPYRSRGPVFVREAAEQARPAPGTVPESFRGSLFAVRGYDRSDSIAAAEVVPGTGLEAVLEDFLAQPDIAYLHLHYARYGCYAARADRA